MFIPLFMFIFLKKDYYFITYKGDLSEFWRLSMTLLFILRERQSGGL